MFGEQSGLFRLVERLGVVAQHRVVEQLEVQAREMLVVDLFAEVQNEA